MRYGVRDAAAAIAVIVLCAWGLSALIPPILILARGMGDVVASEPAEWWFALLGVAVGAFAIAFLMLHMVATFPRPSDTRAVLEQSWRGRFTAGRAVRWLILLNVAALVAFALATFLFGPPRWSLGVKWSTLLSCTLLAAVSWRLDRYHAARAIVGAVAFNPFVPLLLDDGVSIAAALLVALAMFSATVTLSRYPIARMRAMPQQGYNHGAATDSFPEGVRRL